MAHKCKSCKIGSMKKKKHRVSGLGSANAIEIGAFAGGGIGGALGIQKAKEFFVPMLIEGKTPEEAANYDIGVQIASGAIGVAAIVGGVMVIKKSDVGGSLLIGTGAGILAQTALYAWFKWAADPTAKLSGRKWDAKAWAEKRKALIGGADNAGAGLMGLRHHVGGADNAGAGLMGAKDLKLTKPLLTMVDQVGRSFKQGGCGL